MSWAEKRNILEQDYDMLELETHFSDEMVVDIIKGLMQMACAESEVVRTHVAKLMGQVNYDLDKKSETLEIRYSLLLESRIS